MASWTQLEKACKNCTKCPLHETRTNVVFGTGRTDAEIMLIGEGPGESEDLQGEPFVGKAGQLLDDMLKLIGLDRKLNVYIANIVKCRPPHNRDPLFSEQDACMDWLRNQYALVRPKVVICLGRIAASALIHPDFKITKEHGKWFVKDGVKFTAIYHPSALLRDESKRPETFVDLKNILQVVKTTCTNTYLPI
ncbi:MAG: uracil-DNA glycosylase [Oscillospiraceae bacterium]|nr:uracil-DNA glycosylase [Oscillospiraceae bacterium]